MKPRSPSPRTKQHVAAIATLVGLVAPLTHARAQTAADSIPVGNVWLSVGLGSGSVSGSLAGELALWYGGRRFAGGVQANGDEAIFGQGRDAIAFLAGVSRVTPHERSLIALGPAAFHADVCSDDGGCSSNVHDVALGFAGETFINGSVIGIGLDTFGALDPHGGSYIALALALQLGWLRNGQ